MMSMTMMVGMLMIMTDHTTYKNKDVSKSCVIFVKLPELHQSFWGAENSHDVTQTTRQMIIFIIVTLMRMMMVMTIESLVFF